MRTFLIVALLGLFAANTEAGEPMRSSLWVNTRPLTSSASRLLAQAARSPTLEALLDDLDRTDVVVYLSDSASGGESGPPAFLTFVSYAAGMRYVMVHVDPCWRAHRSERLAQLAHELQHALEVSQAPEVRNVAGLADLYRRIGWECRKDRFESVAAVDVGNRVRGELAGFIR